jgi:hypothetical protein
MKILEDCFGHSIRLTVERLAHLLEHSEMREFESNLESVLRNPQMVRRSKSDEQVRLFYRFLPVTIVGAKWLCVVVKYVELDAFVVTAYLTDKPKTGEELWPIN